MYAAKQDIENRLDPKHLIELADDDNDGVADAAVIEAALQDADSVIDSLLKVRYALPFSPAPALLTKLAADLAVASLFGRRRESASPVHEARARAAVDMVAAISRGEIALSGAPIKVGADSTTRGVEKTFGAEQLEDF